MPIRAIVEIVLRVRDIDASLAFYRDTLGLDLFSPPGLPGKFLRVGDKDGIPMQVVLVPGAVTAPDGAPPAIKPRASTTSASKLTPPTGNLSATASRPPATPPATAPTHSCPSTPSTSTTPTATKSRSPQRAPEQGPRRALCIASGELPLRSPQPQPAPAQSDRAQGHSGRQPGARGDPPRGHPSGSAAAPLSVIAVTPQTPPGPGPTGSGGGASPLPPSSPTRYPPPASRERSQ